MTNDSKQERHLRDSIQQIKARYDDHFPPAIYEELKRMESDLAWSRYKRGVRETQA